MTVNELTFSKAVGLEIATKSENQTFHEHF